MLLLFFCIIGIFICLSATIAFIVMKPKPIKSSSIHHQPDKQPTKPDKQPVKSFYEGDKKATVTYFTQGESPGAGACGGCIYPGQKNKSDADFSKNNFENLFQAIQGHDKTWTMAAASEAMMAPYCPNSLGMGCVGRPNPSGATAVAPCGSCWELISPHNQKVRVVIADSCPCGNRDICPTTADPGGHADNSTWCRAEPGDRNSKGFTNHFDVWNGNRLWNQDVESVSFANIPCPDFIRKLMKESCCGTYYDGSQGGNPQGCPNICGPEYSCPP